MKSVRKLFRIPNSRQYFQDQTKAVPTRKQNVSIEPLPQVEYNMEYFCNPANRDAIYDNIKRRCSKANIDKVLQLSQKVKENPTEDCSCFLEAELSKMPNCTDPNVLKLGEEAKELKICGTRPTFNFKPREFRDIVSKLKMMKTESLGPVCGQRSYVFLGALAELEQALINYTVATLMKHNFTLFSVPDILPTEIIARCGLLVNQDRTLVYNLKPDTNQNYNISLSGTAEMALAYKLINSTLSYEQLPLKIAAVSRCYRAETSSLAKERGIYRVHQFSKVEMFVCCDEEESSDIMKHIVDIQMNMFNELKLYFKAIDMPPHELGSPAYRKIDIEGWMPGRQLFGELTSCSNCTDYQSRRLNIKYKTIHDKMIHVHTLNGTACALPRMLIAILETYQLRNGDVAIPEVLIPYMKGKTVLSQHDNIPEMRIHKYNPRNEINKNSHKMYYV